MSEAFIIMQIGNPDLDAVCSSVIVPAIEACGLQARRVDKHNQGNLLKSEIIRFIESSEIIVADVTNERPNCYLEIGYAMGVGKFKNLILTVREDHNLESPNHAKGGPKVHFDLSGYDILFWRSDRLEEFRSELEKRIRRRRAVLAPASSVAQSPWDEDWIASHRQLALKGLAGVGRTAFMEARFALDQAKVDVKQRALDEAARRAPIHTFGWPIGVYLENRAEYRPRPTVEGIVAEIAIADRSSYDYWSLRKNGDFYLLASLFEDERAPDKIFFDTRIVRATEVLLYCARLYAQLGVDPSVRVGLALRHGGLRDRTIGAANPLRLLFEKPSSKEDAVDTQVTTTLGGIESDLVQHVKTLVAPLFVLFDFFEVQDSVYQQMVDNFVQGRVT